MSLTRKAILISAHTNKHGYLPGAKQDLALYRHYLTCPVGGAWEDSELATFENPTAREVRESVQAARDIDFVFMAFSGHGEHHIAKQLSDTSLCLNDTEEIYVGDLNPGARRQVVVIDACRRVVLLERRKAAATLIALANRASAVDWMYRQRCRALFDKEFSDAEEGRVPIYSCGLNQAAQETEDGGIFTKALIDSALRWKDLTQAVRPDVRPEVLDVPNVFEMAKKEVPAPQMPVLHNGRRMHSFPFGVSPKK